MCGACSLSLKRFTRPDAIQKAGFVFLPIGTDAPLYHRPWATGLLIGLNVAAAFVNGCGYTFAYQDWILEYGNGMHPLQWVTCNFLHFGILHLAGNMLFLWVFGLIVEGKIGFLPTLLVYTIIGVGHAAVEQGLMLGYTGAVEGSGGASGIVYGVLAMALVWAPRNEVTYVYFFIFFMRVITGEVEVTVMTLGLCYIGIEFATAAWGGMGMSSSVIHLLGGSVGFVVATFMLKRKLVDCENWDLYAYLKGTHGDTKRDYNSTALQESLRRKSDSKESWLGRNKRARAEQQRQEEVALRERESQKKSEILKRLRGFVQQGKPTAAMAELHRLEHLHGKHALGQSDLSNVIDLLFRNKSWGDAVPLLEQFVERFPAEATLRRLQLAGIYVKVQTRPRAALRVLEPIETVELSEALEKQRVGILHQAQKLVEEGVLELEGRSW